MNQLNFTGTINPDALHLPALNHKPVRASFDEIARLSAQAEKLKRENQALKLKLKTMIDDPEGSAFCKFQGWVESFREKLKTREDELEGFAQYLNSYRVRADPSFVEIDASRYKKPKYDNISVSILVNNPQRSFFNKGQLEDQNQELKRLIDNQAQTLRMAKTRLKLFQEYQQSNAVKETLEALQSGDAPTTLAGATPTRSVELRAKRRQLTQELITLIKKRKALAATRLVQKAQRRIESKKKRAAKLIQAVWRGYMARVHFKKMTNAMEVIKRTIHAYVTKIRQRKLEEQVAMASARVFEDDEQSGRILPDIDNIEEEDKRELTTTPVN